MGTSTQLIVQGLSTINARDMVALGAENFGHDFPQGVMVLYQNNI